MPEQLRVKARKDWENEEIEAVGDFETYLRGYIAAIKRFSNVQNPQNTRTKSNS